MSRRRLDLAAAQQRLTSAIAPDEVVAIARTALGASATRSRQLAAATLTAAFLVASAWQADPHPGLSLVLFAVPLSGHLALQLIVRRSRSSSVYLIAITNDRLLLCDYPADPAPVRVIFASPTSALQLEVRSSGRLAEIDCTVAGGGQLTLFGRRRRKLVLVVSSDDQARRVCEAFVSRGGIGPPAVPYRAALATTPVTGRLPESSGSPPRTGWR